MEEEDNVEGMWTPIVVQNNREGGRKEHVGGEMRREEERKKNRCIEKDSMHGVSSFAPERKRKNKKGGEEECEDGKKNIMKGKYCSEAIVVESSVLFCCPYDCPSLKTAYYVLVNDPQK